MVSLHRSCKRVCFLTVTVIALVSLFTFGAGAISYGSVSDDGTLLKAAPAESSDTVAVLSEGDALAVMDDSAEAWLPVQLLNQNEVVAEGYINREQTYFSAYTGADAAGHTLHQTASVSGIGTLLYSSADNESQIITRIVGTTTVTLLSIDEEGWMYVVYTTDNGSFYGFLAPDSAIINAIGYGEVGELDVTLFKTTDPSSQSCGLLSSGTEVEILGIWEGFYLVRSGETQGFVSRSLINENTVEPILGFGTVNGNNLWLRSEASSDSQGIIRLAEGTAVVISGETDGWYQIRYNGQDGYLSADYVTFSNTTSTGFVQVSAESAQLRSGAGESFDVISELPEGELLTVVGNLGDWLMVENDSATGFLPYRDLSATTECGYRVGSLYATMGEEVAAFACQFNGNPYVWGGTSLTKGADCSGFVMKVYQNFGVSLPHSSSGMRSYGRGVSYGEMQPGDIVCYSGHVGIYAGNGQIINALGAEWGITYTDVNYKNILSIRRIFD